MVNLILTGCAGNLRRGAGGSVVLPLIFNLLIILALGGGVFKVAKVLRFGVHGSLGTGYPTRREG